VTMRMEFRPTISYMNRIFILLALSVAAALDGAAATLPIYINGTPLVSPPQIAPQIDARAWANQAGFNVTRFNLSSLPYESLNTRFFTNNSFMYGDPGYRFFRNTNGQRFWMDWWVNNGTIETDRLRSFTLLGNIVFFFNDSRASMLHVAATNIVNIAPISSGAQGLIRLEGRRIDVSRSTLRTGLDPFAPPLTNFTSIGATNYVNDFGIYDLYWGAGTNNTLNGQGRGLPLVTFNLPSPSSQTHQVLQPSIIGPVFQTITTVPFSSFGNYAAAVYTNSISPTSQVVQIVFYPSNSFDTNFTVDVRFVPPGLGFNGPAEVMVAFQSRDFDIVSETETTEAIYLVDGLAAVTNRAFARNLNASTRRPTTYEVTRNVPFGFSSGIPGNTAFSPSLIVAPNLQLTTVTNEYAAYSARVDLASTSPSGSVPYDPTNMPGRIEILGEEVNMEETRIRADSSVTIKANTNLVSNRLPQIDAPFVNIDVRSVAPELVVSNIAPLTVRRLSGTVSAWSGLWNNFDSTVITTGTNVFTNTTTILTHVLIVDSQLQAVRPVTVNEFSVRGTNLVIQDHLNIGRSFRLEGASWHLTGGLTLPFGYNLGASNLVNLRNFTNDGIINILGSENFGADRVLSYSNYVNRGTNIAAAHYIRTRNFENTAYLQANGGQFSLDSVSASLVGPPLVQETIVTEFPFGTNIFSFTNTVTLQAAPTIEGVSDVQIYARDLVTSNSIINAGKLVFGVTNSLIDGGAEGISRWSVNNGFQSVRRPATSSMLGTYLKSTLARQRQADHIWTATNLGLSAAGFTNNMALGKLILDGGSGSLFRFMGAGNNNALYVDYIELTNTPYSTALNDAGEFNKLFAGPTNFTIYFANANVPATKLDGMASGRFRWVQSYTGPLSSTNITYVVTNGVVVTTNTYTFNIALVSSIDIDSDGDGLVNADDPTPIYVASSARLSLSLTAASAAPRDVELKWLSLKRSSNFLEFKASAAAAEWQVLTNFRMGDFTWPVAVKDPVTTNGAGRVYRLRVDPGPY